MSLIFFAYRSDITNAFLLIYQLGACCIYVVFVASNIKDIVDYFCDDDIDVRLFMVFILLPLILINWVSIRTIAFVLWTFNIEETFTFEFIQIINNNSFR